MSALFGLIYLTQEHVISSELEGMSKVLSALGVDGHSTWSHGRIGLGSHLMRFTPEDFFEKQPLFNFDKQLVLVCDARIDNRQEMAAALDLSATETYKLPDSAFVLKSYEAWGADCVDHIVGDYALALWDANEQRLFLARSPVGGRPLYYHATPEFFAFSSRPNALFALKKVPRKLNLERLADYLVRAPVEIGVTFFHGIERLHAGHVLTIGREGIQMRRFWQPESLRELRYADDNEYVDNFNGLFKRVVSDHLRSFTPAGVMMSGGLDSTSVAALAAIQLRQDGKRLTTFTEVPGGNFNGKIVKGRYADETPYVQAMFRKYDNIELNLIRTGNRFYLDGIESFFDVANMPFRNASNRTWFELILQEARHKGVRVLLTGAQGNLTISRNGQELLPMLISTGRWRRAIHEARCMDERTLLWPLLGQGILPLLPKSIYTALQRIRGRHAIKSGAPSWSAYSAINPDFARSQRVNERGRDKGFDVNFCNHANVRLTYGKTLIGLTMMANEMQHPYRELYGMDIRDPTADVRIVEFCLSLPEEQYLKDGVARRLIRRAMAGKLPVEILENRQRGLQAADWFDRLLASRQKLLLELAEWSRNDLLSEILDLKRMINLLENMPQAQGDIGKILMDYRQVLESGLMMGRFICWFENGESGRA